MPKSLNEQSKKSIYLNNVSKLDGLGKGKDLFTTGEGLSLIETICGQFIERVIENINKADIIDTGSITDITVVPTDKGVNIEANPHLVFQSRGVSGTEVKYDTPHSYTDKMPPVDVIKEWLKRKGTSDEDLNGAAWAIAKSIQKKGLKPHDLYEKEIPKLLEDLQREIADFMIQHIIQDIDINPKGGGQNRIIIK